MSSENRMTSAPSPQGRRILIAVVTGVAGDLIQDWRLVHDAKEAMRLPPHATLCYWAPDARVEDIERQVSHAFSEPIEVRLGQVQQGDNDQGTLFVEVIDQEALNQGLERLYDGRYVLFPEKRETWRWHVTCVRDTRCRELDSLLRAARTLQLDQPWRFNTVALMELRGDQYHVLARFFLGG